MDVTAVNATLLWIRGSLRTHVQCSVLRHRANYGNQHAASGWVQTVKCAAVFNHIHRLRLPSMM